MSTLPVSTDHWDEDAFFALADVAAYRGFVDRDWELDTLTQRFVEQMHEGHLAICYVGPDDDYEGVDFVAEASPAVATREVVLPITCTTGELQAVSYTALTMVAQFDDTTLAEEASGPKVQVPAGDYAMTVRVLGAPGDGYARLEVVLRPGTATAPDQVPWFTID